MGALATLTLDYGLPVVTSSDTAETARFIAVSARRETKMLEHLSETAQERLRASEHPDMASDADGVFDPTAPILDATEGTMSEERRREMHGITRSMLEQVPGIGPALASRILDRWPTMAALANASDDEIVQVPGLSISLAQEIVRILHGSGD